MAQITPASLEDLDRVRALVAAAGLPTEGISDSFPTAYAVARLGTELVGVAGLEVHGTHGLLRSVAVAPAQRGAGLGRQLVEDRLRFARTRGLDAVYLLTTTAAAWFRALGFTDAARDAAPAPLRASSEFAAVCPSTAVCLTASLPPAAPS